MASAQKKVIVRLFKGGTVSGYLPAQGLVEYYQVLLMDAAGRAITFPLIDIKLIAYVWNFNGDDLVEPERLGRKRFAARPRNEGVWVRVTFLDGDVLEGICALDVTLLDGIIADSGVSLTPPDARANTHRVYVPRTAMAEFEVLGVVTSAAKRKQAAKPEREPQPGLFGEG